MPTIIITTTTITIAIIIIIIIMVDCLQLSCYLHSLIMSIGLTIIIIIIPSLMFELYFVEPLYTWFDWLSSFLVFSSFSHLPFPNQSYSLMH